MTATWQAVRHGFPGATGLAAWIAVTVPLPLLYFDATHRWEEHQSVSSALWWVMAALPALAATVGARCARVVGRHRTDQAFAIAVVAAMLVSLGFLLGSLAFYRWVLPLGEATGSSIWWIVLLGGPPVAIVSGAIGYGISPKTRQPDRRATPFGYFLGAAVAVGGALVAPATVQLGAEASTVWYDDAVSSGGYGGVGPDIEWKDQPGVLKLPGPGRYAVWRIGPGPGDPDCWVSGSGITEPQADLLTVQPGGYGSDYATFTWVASFTAPRYGSYSLTCVTSDGSGRYAVGDVPQIRGLVGALIDWPLVLIWLLGSLPGLLIIASTISRRARYTDAPVFT